MGRTRALALWLLLRLRRKRICRQKRKYWVHPINERRSNLGAFNVLMNQLRDDEAKFFNYFRMNPASFDELLGRIEPLIRRQNTVMRDCIPPTMMLAITLR